MARPQSGTALIEGRRYEELEDPRRTVGAALDSMGFHPGRTGRNHLRVVARAAGINPSRVDEVLEVVGQTAAGARIVIHELTTETGTAQLEQMFLELTGKEQEALS